MTIGRARPHRRHRRTVQSYSPGSANVPSMRAHWRHLANTIKLLLPSAHPSPQPKRQIDRSSRFCTDDRRVSLYFTMGDARPHQNCPFPCGIWTPSNTWFPGPIPESSTQINSISIGSAVFAGHTNVTDRLTYHATWSVTIGRIYVYVVLQCGLIITIVMQCNLT